MRAALCAAAVAFVFTSTAIATAEPANSDGAQQTIARLESEGYDVIIDRVGSEDLSHCAVTDVRHPQTLTQTIVTGHDHNRQVETIIVSKSIHVTLDCGA